MTDIRNLKMIAEDQTMNASEKALECVCALPKLPQKDLARPDYRAAAQAFALLAVAEALTTSATGNGLADTIVRYGAAR